MTDKISRSLDALGLLAIGLVLAVAFADQLLNHELPCPLCLLQRVGFVLDGFGLAMNLVFRPRASHYGLTILGAMAGGAVALRQILLHVVPGTGAYGAPFLGLHFYTWAAILFTLIVVGSAILLLFDARLDASPADPEPISTLARIALVLFALLAVGNALSTFLECGLGLCPDNPTEYEMLHQ
ncbi:disulfide bond formation protein B [Thiocapsa roseopersicina]|uniref:Disulfide bond formation protein DsbB n=1 Tax=Thiocapsa roseopersicina TaxID=1058 RepID=A0A1H3CKG7_THIRO|nr:disulfide bond formation protein B [Thiocapsa roseopersicina]SDX54627.1 Disulfide bond formation protein DsbB [Thiocapsa roseopersicina]